MYTLSECDVPPPANGIRQDATERRPRRRARGEDDVDVALPDAALAQGHNIRHEDGDDGRHAAAADARDAARHAQLHHGLGEAAAETTEAKDGIGKEQTLLAAEDVAELAVERLAAGEGEKVPTRIESVVLSEEMRVGPGRGVRGGDPAHAVEGVEVIAHLGVGGQRDELVYGREQQLDVMKISVESRGLDGKGTYADGDGGEEDVDAVSQLLDAVDLAVLRAIAGERWWCGGFGVDDGGRKQRRRL